MINAETIEIPTLDLIIPEPNINWAYQTYTNLILDVTEAELENIPGELSGIWSRFQVLHDRLWSVGFDLVAAMGYVNVLSDERSKEIMYGRTLYVSNRTVFEEALRTKNLRLYLTTRLDIEKQRQVRHIEAQGLQMEYAKGMIEASVAAFNVAVEEFNAEVDALRLEVDRYDAILAGNEVVLKRLDKDLMDDRLASEYIKGNLRRQRALVGVRMAEADVQKLDAEIRLNAARVVAADIAVQRNALQAVLIGTQAIAEQAQALSLQVDAQVIQAEAGEIDVLIAANEQIAAQIENITQVKVARDAMYAALIADKEALLAKFIVANALLLAANTAYTESQRTLTLAENVTEMVKYTADDSVEDIRVAAGDSIEDAQFDTQSLIDESRFRSEADIDNARTTADGTVTVAKIKADGTTTAARFKADADTNAARLKSEISLLITAANFQSALTVAESQYKISMEAAKLAADIAIQAVNADGSIRTKAAQFSLEMQKLVSSWKTENDRAEFTTASDEIKAKQVGAEMDAREVLAEARSAAAETLKSAKVINRFTEYR